MYIHFISPKQTSAFLRVVIEKPFGEDTTSAIEMARDLKQNLAEEELYRVDHYLGKQGTLGILALRWMGTLCLGRKLCKWHRG